MDEYSKIIRALEVSGRKLILSHVNADPDAIGSAVALKLSFPEITIGAVESIQPIARKICERVGVQAEINPAIENFDAIFIIDTSTKAQICQYAQKIQESKKPVYIIDHHARSDWQADVYLCDELPSCAEVVFSILKKAGKQITKDAALALLCAIITDTGKFRYAEPETHKIFAELLETSGLSHDDVFSILEGDEENGVSMRIAHLKCGQRAQFEQVGDFIIAWSNLSSFEGSASRVLVNAGADVAFVLAESKGEFRISGRASWRAVNAGLHLGKMMQEIGKQFNCSGGGHGGAAGLNGKQDGGKALGACVEEAKRVFSGILSNKT
ncbi:MAG: DHH family phosphoesterase [Candidatus Thermoplasmatota archaeon]|nr:DHH family phosphoesterase [Candidatus Thermoplasmatota archaeon]